MIIPGDIKVKNNLNPNIQGRGIHKEKIFSFEEGKNLENKINVFPKSLSEYLDSDMSFSNDLSSSYYVNNLPKIKIKEYLPEIPEDQWLNVFGDTFNVMSATFEAWKSSKDSFSRSMENLRTKTSNGELVRKIVEKIKEKNPSIQQTQMPFGLNDLEKAQLYWFPEFLYRRLLSYQVTNWYVLPYSGIIQMGSRGQNGWQHRNLDSALGGIQKFMKSVNITGRPLWRLNGMDTDNIEFEVFLFNDTFRSAAANFRFVHSIVPNNMWFQYGVFQHNPSLYDIQFDGGLRYFCCSLDVNCEAVGTLRNHPEGFIESVVGVSPSAETEVNQKRVILQVKIKKRDQILDKIDENTIQFAKTMRQIQDLEDEIDQMSDNPETQEKLEEKESLEKKSSELNKENDELHIQLKDAEHEVDLATQDYNRAESNRNSTRSQASSKYSGEGYSGYFKIPDIYKLTFRFKSLLPTNFNTYLMTFNEKPVFEEGMEDESGHFTTIYDTFVRATGEVISSIVQANANTKP